MNHADQASADAREAREAVQRRRALLSTIESIDVAISYDRSVFKSATGARAIVLHSHIASERARIEALETGMRGLASYAIEMADAAVIGYTLAALPAVASYYEEHRNTMGTTIGVPGHERIRRAIVDHYDASTLDEHLAAIATAQDGVPDALVSELRRIITGEA
jgi:phosphoribosylaminoimidazole (AIR) synthetase